LQIKFVGQIKKASPKAGFFVFKLILATTYSPNSRTS
jgi:hypothetical protein